MSYNQALCEPREHEHRGSYFSRIPSTPAVLTGVLLLLLAGCGPKDGHYNPSHFRATGAIAPPEVIVPSAAQAGAIDGLYLETADSSVTALCCWIGTRASVQVQKTRSAAALKMSLYVPKVPAFEDRSQTVTVQFAGFPKKIIFSGLKPGFHTVTATVPAKLRKRRGAVRIDVDCAIPYVVSVGAKSVRYGTLLTSIFFT